MARCVRTVPMLLAKLTISHQAKVTDLENSIHRKVNIGWLEIPMDQVLAVNIFNTGADLAEMEKLLMYGMLLSIKQT